MKKVLILLACVTGAIAGKAQTGITNVVYIPQTGICYEASAISTATNGNILVLSMTNAVNVQPTRERIKTANDCTKGEFRNDDTHGGTHNVECDITVNTTCFCTGIK